MQTKGHLNQSMISRVYAHFFIQPVLNHLLSCKDAMVPVFHRKCFPSWRQRREDSEKIGFPFFDSPPLRLFQPKMVGNGDLKNLLSFQTWWCFFPFMWTTQKKRKQEIKHVGRVSQFPSSSLLVEKSQRAGSSEAYLLYMGSPSLNNANKISETTT